LQSDGRGRVCRRSVLVNLEYIERIAAKPVFLFVFNGALIATWIIYGTAVANILISIVTAELVLLGLGANRRSQFGLHAKLDELVSATDKARNDLVHVEDLSEKEIEEKRL